MTPTAIVEVIFGTSVAYGSQFVLGDPLEGILGVNVLGEFNRFDISDQVFQISVDRGRDDIFNSYQDGRAVVQFRDDTGNWNPQNESSPLFGQILPFRQMRISANYDGVTSRVFTGWVQSFSWRWEPGLNYATVTLNCEDSFRLLNLAEVTAVPGAATGDLTSERITQILDAVDWPVPLRNIGSGTLTVQNDNGEPRRALAALQQVEQAELGAFYVDQLGRVTFEGQTALANRATSTPTSFDDFGGIDFNRLQIDLDDRRLANEVTRTIEGGTPQTVRDQNSIDTFFLRSDDLDGLILEENADALRNAEKTLRVRANPQLRIESLGLNLAGADQAKLAAAFNTQFNDPLQMTFTAPGGPISVRLIVDGISHRARPGSWQTTFKTGTPLLSRFILGSSTFGRLGINTL
jgi:hypothetical protein